MFARFSIHAIVNIIFDRRRSFTEISVRAHILLACMAKLRARLPTFLARIWARPLTPAPHTQLIPIIPKHYDLGSTNSAVQITDPTLYLYP